MSPALYEKYVNKTDIYVADEWTLCLAMGADGAEELEGHYKTFIVRCLLCQWLSSYQTLYHRPSATSPRSRVCRLTTQVTGHDLTLT